MTQLRPFILLIGSVLTGLGILPPEAEAYIEANADAILSGVLALWGLIALLRNRKEKATNGST